MTSRLISHSHDLFRETRAIECKEMAVIWSKGVSLLLPDAPFLRTTMRDRGKGARAVVFKSARRQSHSGWVGSESRMTVVVGRGIIGNDTTRPDRTVRPCLPVGREFGGLAFALYRNQTCGISPSISRNRPG